MCHRETNYEFAVISDNEINNIREAEKTLSQQNGEVILLAYRRSDQNMKDK